MKQSTSASLGKRTTRLSIRPSTFSGYLILRPKMANHSCSENLSNQSVLVRNCLLHEFDIGRCVACVSLIVFSLLSNMVIVFSYCLNYRMRTTTNTMVLNHCLVDILLALSDTAFYLTPAFIPRLMDNDLFCNLSVFFDSFFKAASILSMCGIAIDRYINLVRASRKRMTKAQAITTLAWCWMQSTIVAIPWSTLTRWEGTISELTQCHTLPRLFEVGLPLSALSVFFKTACVLLPLLGIYYISYRVFSASRQRRKVETGDSLLQSTHSVESLAARTQSRSPITAIILFVIFIICTTPFLVAIVWTMFPENQALAPGVAFAVYFSFRLKGSLFPVLYILRNRFVLNSLQKLICCYLFSAKASILSGGNAFVIKHNSGINLADCNWVIPKQAVTNGFQRRGARQDSRIFYVSRTATVKLDFTDLKTARGDP